MSWFDSLKKIRNTLTASGGVNEKKSKGGLADYTIQQLEDLFSKNTFDRKLLEDLLDELKCREEEYKKSGKDISPSIYKLRFVVFERIQEIKHKGAIQEEESLSTKADAPEQSDEEIKEENGKTVASEAIDATLTVAANSITDNQGAHPSEQFADTQFHNGDENEEKQEIKIGLDFGTAFTKVVLGTPLGARAVPLTGDFHATSDYLLPGILSIEKNGDCHLGIMKGCKRIDDLKMKLIDAGGELQLESRVHVVAYLALLFRKIRWWWIDQQGSPEVFRNHGIAWVINSGLPTESMDGEIPILYRQIILAAWAASVDEGAINTKQIGETCELAVMDQSIVTYDDKDQNEYLENNALDLLPEFLAQTAVYISHDDAIDKRRLHMMIDIGAGTIDMTIFNVYEWQGEIRHAIYGKKVIPYGVNYLIKNRLSKLGKDPTLASQFYMENISDQQFADKVGVRIGQLEDVDRPFLEQVVTHLASLRNQVRNDPDVSQDRSLLEQGLKLFLAGGGARVDAYQKRIRRFAQDNGLVSNRNTVEIGQLPDIGQVEERERHFVAPGLDRRDYDRLSVAYGLSDDPWNLAELLDEEQINKINKRARRDRDRLTRGDTGGAFWDDPNAPPVW